jgi:hypothetical protein
MRIIRFAISLMTLLCADSLSGQQSGNFFNRIPLSSSEKILNLKTVDSHPNIQPLAIGLESRFDLHPDSILHAPIAKKFINIAPIVSLGTGFQFAQEQKALANGIVGLNAQLNNSKWSAQIGYSAVGGLLPSYLENYVDSLLVMPGVGFASNRGSNAPLAHYTYGHVSYSNGKHFHFELGKGKHFWGDGYRSMILSDNASSYPYARITTKVWKLKYTNLWTQMRDLTGSKNRTNARIKYTAMHALSFNAGRKFNFSIYEMVVWQDRDTMSRRTLDINYLNPIIFYRPVEYSVGSPDNVILATSMKYRPKSWLQLYGQFVLDEFNLKQFQGNKKWWANKLGGQFGVKMFDVVIPNLNIQTEVNVARPFTYTHGSPIQSWTHLNQSLAHPMGCNFIEWVSFIRYQKKEWTFLEQFSWAAFGRDRDVNNDGIIDNLGGNILRSYKDPFEQYGHSILQGDKSNFFYHAFTVSRALPKFESFEIFLNHTLRYDQNETRRNLDHFIMVGVRVIGLLQMATDY